MYIIFRFLLNITHLLYILYYFAQQKCIWIMLALQHCKYLNKQDCNYSIVNIRNHLVVTSKFPKHLAILIGLEDVSILDIVRLISWCVIAEIPYVSFYDHKGVLRENETLIRKKLNELEPFIAQNVDWLNLSQSKIKDKQIVSEMTEVKANSVCRKIVDNNTVGIVTKYKTRIQILSYNDGKQKIVNLTKILAKTIDLNIIQEKDITPEFIDNKLNLHVPMPDPDIAIIFGETLCTYGFMPWQTRVTEFFLIPTHHKISSKSFVETLIKFSQCQQRYGK